MKDINKVLCESMYNFVKAHINEVTEKKDIFGHDVTYDDLGFKSKDDMFLKSRMMLILRIGH